MLIWFLFGAMCMGVVLFGLAYLKFVSLNKAAQNAWQKLDNNMKNRAELIPVLALSAASFSELDREFIYELSHMKEACRTAQTLQERVAKENEITQKFKKVFTAAMKHAEGKVQSAKKKYNSAARDFNTIATIIPLNFVAKMFEFEPYEYFDFDPSLEKVME